MEKQISDKPASQYNDHTTNYVHLLQNVTDFKIAPPAADTSFKFLPPIPDYNQRQPDASERKQRFAAKYELEQTEGLTGNKNLFGLDTDTQNSTNYSTEKDWKSKLTGGDLADAAGFAGLALSYKYNLSEWSKKETGSLAAIPMAGLAGYSLFQDSKNLFKSRSLIEGSFYAAAGVADLGALAGTAMMLSPKTRSIGDVVRSVSFGTRAAFGLENQIVTHE